MSTAKTTIRWFGFFPSQADANSNRAYVGLRANYDPQLVELLKRRGRVYRKAVPGDAPAVWFNDKGKCWIIAPEAWSWVRRDLLDNNYTLRNSACPKDVEEFWPDHSHGKEDKKNQITLADALAFMHGAGITCEVRNGKFGVVVPPGRPFFSDIAAVIAAHRELLHWLLSTSVVEYHSTSAQKAEKPPADPWAVLGITRSATASEIDAAYRDRIRRVHPDRLHGLDAELVQLAESKAKAINVAYDKVRSYAR